MVCDMTAMDWLELGRLAEILLIVVGCPVGVVLLCIIAEVSEPINKWVSARVGFCDTAQSPTVRKCAVRLASRKTTVRLAAVKLLGEMNDSTAVQALTRAAERYRKDVPLLQAVVEALARIRDPRGLDTLKRLSHGHNAALMLAARQAVTDLEGPAVLLRSTDRSPVGEQNLLTPANTGKSEPRHHLVRPVQ